MQERITKEAILQNLRDAGCDEGLIQRFLDMGESATLCEQMKLLSRHRCCLLEHMHMVQKQIDCLDYLLWQMKKGVPMDCCCQEDGKTDGKNDGKHHEGAERKEEEA